jgi:F-type H+-transporting ATPase subunit a
MIKLGLLAAMSPDSAGHEASVGEQILHHVIDSPAIGLGITKTVIMMAIAALTVFVGVRRALAGYDRDGVPSTRWSQMLDPFVEHFYRDVALKYTGHTWAPRVAPLLMTFFFFILTCNLLGLIPITELAEFVAWSSGGHLPAVMQGSATATANFNVTLALASITFFAILLFGIWKHGVVGHFAHLAPAGVPFLIRWFLLPPIELASMFVRPIALTMRLAANMTGGHLAVLSLIFVIFLLKQAAVGLVVVPTVVLILLLELIVCFVQAYVFALLSGVFIGLAVESHH